MQCSLRSVAEGVCVRGKVPKWIYSHMHMLKPISQDLASNFCTVTEFADLLVLTWTIDSFYYPSRPGEWPHGESLPAGWVARHPRDNSGNVISSKGITIIHLSLNPVKRTASAFDLGILLWLFPLPWHLGLIVSDSDIPGTRCWTLIDI